MKIRITTDVDTETGEYDIGYNNLSHPGSPIDLTELMGLMREIFAQHERIVNEDADLQTTGQAKRDPGDLQ